MTITDSSKIIIGLDLPCMKRKRKEFKRGYFVLRYKDFLHKHLDHAAQVDHKSMFAKVQRELFSTMGPEDEVHVFLYPTRTYAEGFGGDLLSGIAPEDRAVVRKLTKRFGKRVHLNRVYLHQSEFFDSIEGYFSDEDEEKRYKEQKGREPEPKQEGEGAPKRAVIGFDMNFIRNVKDIFKSCMTRPNRQDFFYLATKTFGINLLVRTFFAVTSYMKGDLPLARAIASTSWYQVQDIVFTIFGQTYMKFLGRMTGMLRVWNAYIGDFLFVYIQFCFFEFLNRLILGPLGENPLAYTWHGIALILINNFQGLISGGPLVPAINKVRKAGLISHSMMMHLYQLGSLCFYFGLFASFGYQTVYFILTTSVMVLAWGSYLGVSAMYKDPEFNQASLEVLAELDKAAARCYTGVHRGVFQ